MKDKPTHKQCRNCGEWFALRRNASPTQRFCSTGCSATYRTSKPKWRKAHSEKIKAQTNPEVMRQRSLAAWANPETRARMTEATRKRANEPEHQAWMIEHNKRLWTDKEFRKGHLKRNSKVMADLWADPAFRQKQSEMTAAANKKRWADPEYKARTAQSIRIAKLTPLAHKRAQKMAKEVASRPLERARRAELMKQRWANPEMRAKMAANCSEALRKKYRDDPAYHRMKTAQIAAVVRSPEHRTAVSERNKRQWADPEYRAKRLAAWTPERRAAWAAKIREQWADPAFKARVAAKISATKRKNGGVNANDTR
jgi:hypothetical protein